MDGTYLNIRAFELPYADYRGSFKDNPFEIEAKQLPEEGPPEGKYLKEAVESFAEISNSGGGDLIYATGTDHLTDRLRAALEKEKGKNVDIVICLDTTGSMKKYIDPLRLKLIPMLRELTGSLLSFRIGMVLYKDYFEQYLTRIIPFTNDFGKFQRDLDAIRVMGGGDIPEAVYEALYAGATGFPWEAEAKVMFLVGDAPPHPKPRGKITKEMVNKAVNEKGIKVSAVILPNK
jgi:Mg-chelatase subunit ChlD